ncbi:MAG: sugar ABC transporter substrate-binding protein [Synergistaceae bacterium]|nr:sugar ABC transporter substrate-binding protein [Synergistaceae bacterium]
MRRASVAFLIVAFVLGMAAVSCAEGKKFGATYMTMNNPFFGAMDEAIREAVEANGDTLITLDPALDQVKQIAQIEDLIAQGVDAIFLNPVDWQGVSPALLACKEAGIPVINVDAPVYDEDYVACIVASNNLEAGQLCGTDMLGRIKGGKIVILGHPTTKTGIDRIARFKEIVAEHPSFTIVAEQSSEGQLEIAMPVMENIIQADPDIAAVMCVNDPTALGAIAALRAAGALEGVLIYGVDGSPDAKKTIKNGEMTASAAQSPKNIGVIGVQMAYKILAGETVEKHVPVPVQLITAANVDEFGLDGWQ